MKIDIAHRHPSRGPVLVTGTLGNRHADPKVFSPSDILIKTWSAKGRMIRIDEERDIPFVPRSGEPFLPIKVAGHRSVTFSWDLARVLPIPPESTNWVRLFVPADCNAGGYIVNFSFSTEEC